MILVWHFNNKTMKPFQENNLRYSIHDMIKIGEQPENIVSFLIGFIGEAEKQAAIDALAKAERIEEKQSEPLSNVSRSDYEWFCAIGGRCGMFTAYLNHLSDKLTADEREIIAQEFDKDIFQSDKAMAERFRNANNTSHENN